MNKKDMRDAIRILLRLSTVLIDKIEKFESIMSIMVPTVHRLVKDATYESDSDDDVDEVIEAIETQAMNDDIASSKRTRTM